MTGTSLLLRKLSLHGLPLEMVAPEGLLKQYVNAWLDPFFVSDLPPGVVPTRGILRTYREGEVVRHLSTNAQRVTQVDPWFELYQDGDCFWLVDERWGITEVNFLRGQWRSWILPGAVADPVRIAEGAVLWPLAQLMRPRGLHLLPAMSIVRGGWGALVLAGFSLEPELSRLIRSGYRLVGQRWTAIREEDGRIELLHVPGVVDRAALPAPRRGLFGPSSHWVDLNREHAGTLANHAFCDQVLVVEPGRRAKAHAAHLKPHEAQDLLRMNWPIVDIHPSRRGSQLAVRMALQCRCADVQLSRNPDDLVLLLESLRKGSPRPELTIYRNSLSEQLVQRPAV